MTDIAVAIHYGDLVVDVEVTDVGGYSGEVVSDCANRAVRGLTHALAAMQALSAAQEADADPA